MSDGIKLDAALALPIYETPCFQSITLDGETVTLGGTWFSFF